MAYLISNQIEDDTRFLSMIDDPSQDFNANTRCILSVPIFTSDEAKRIDSLEVQCPRAIL